VAVGVPPVPPLTPEPLVPPVPDTEVEPAFEPPPPPSPESPVVSIMHAGTIPTESASKDQSPRPN
jgi:hypothetical protein